MAKELRVQWSEDRVSGLAAEIAFFGALSIFPALLVLAAALGSLESIVGEDVAVDVQNEIVERVRTIFGSDSQVEDAFIDLFAGGSPGIFTVGIAVAIYSASRGFSTIVGSLDLVYDEQDNRSWLATRLVGLALALGTLIVGALVLAMIVVGPLLGRGPELADRLGLGLAFATAWDWARPPLTLLVLVAWAATIYHVAPNRRSPWRWELPGALLAAVGWVTATLGLRIYLDVAQDGDNPVVGVIGGALSLLLWLFLLAQVLLLGGEFNAILSGRLGVSSTGEAHPPGQLRRWWRTVRGVARRRRLM